MTKVKAFLVLLFPHQTREEALGIVRRPAQGRERTELP